MDNLFPIVDDPVIINQKLMTEAILCMLLNEQLSLPQIAALCEVFYIMNIEFRGKKRYAQLAGFYRHKQLPLIQEEQFIEPIGEKVLLEPFPCILLKDIRGNELLWGLHDLYDIEVIVYNKEDRYAILCDYYKEPPRHLIKPKILDQDWRNNNA